MLKNHFYRLFFSWAALLILVLTLAACDPGPAPTARLEKNRKLQVVATTTIVTDVVAQVAGEAIELVVLLPAGSDPHTFEPTPQDLALLASADLVFMNGFGLEEYLEPLLENAVPEADIVAISAGIQPLAYSDSAGHEGEAQDHEEEDHDHEVDPHVWFDPHNVIVWTENIARELSQRDPANAAVYTANAAAYRTQLQELDAWIIAQVAQVPEDQRLLITDHASFGYFAARYGFKEVGALIPSFSTAAQPSAQELAALQDAIKDLGVKAVFVGTTVNPNLAEQVAADTGVRLVSLYTGSLSRPEEGAGTYLEMMRYNTAAIVAALQ